MSRNKKLSLLLLPVAVLLAVILLSREDDAPQVEVFRAKRYDMTESIPASGRIRPTVEVKISPDVSGEIVSLNFSEGDSVRKGDLLLTIKQDLYISMVEQAEASLNSLRAALEQQRAQFGQAELKLARSETLFSRSAISEAELENVRAEYEVHKAGLSAAMYSMMSGEASLKEAQENLTKTVIYAPMSGIISRMNVEAGERVVGTSQMAGTEMLRIADFSAMELLVEVSESDVVRMAVGDSASIEIDAWPGRSFSGIVTKIANSSQNIGLLNEQVANFGVRISILGESCDGLRGKNPLPIRPGMSASASIVTLRRDAVTAVPVQSVFTKGGEEYVWLIGDDGLAHSRRVVTGIQDMSMIEVEDGVEEGDMVVSAPWSAITSTLKDFMKVKTVLNGK